MSVYIEKVSTDKTMYKPGELVKATVTVTNSSSEAFSGKVVITRKSFTLIGLEEETKLNEQDVSISANSSIDVSITFSAHTDVIPVPTYYVKLLDANGNVIDVKTFYIGVEIDLLKSTVFGIPIISILLLLVAILLR